MSLREKFSLIRINRFIKISFFLGVIQYLVSFFDYDYILHVGPFVTHHFIELPAFGIFGFGLSMLLLEMELSSSQASVINLVLFILLLIPYLVISLSKFLASFAVSSPWLIGFYIHQIVRT